VADCHVIGDRQETALLILKEPSARERSPLGYHHCSACWDQGEHRGEAR